jgi:phosphatidylserine/phosphatidylglycerophosphate/cardiolipin synthase-like enzyme
MKLLVQPDQGITPIVSAIKKAQRTVQAMIFRADLAEVQQALESAVGRGVAVHTLIAHTNRGGEKRLRKLEQALLEAGVTVSRTGDDLVRYHGKMMIIDRKTLFVMGFNMTHLDALASRSFAVVTRHKKVVQEALKLFEADATRQPYVPGLETFVVSPDNSRQQLTAFIKGATKQLLIYDPKIADRPVIRLLQERAKNGVDIRVLGKVTTKAEGVLVEKLPKLRLHVRAILRDGRHLFVGSQSLRPLELDRRREVGVIVRADDVVKQFQTVFEADWALTDLARKAAKKEKKHDKDDDDTQEEGDGHKDAAAAK